MKSVSVCFAGRRMVSFSCGHIECGGVQRIDNVWRELTAQNLQIGSVQFSHLLSIILWNNITLDCKRRLLSLSCIILNKLFGCVLLHVFRSLSLSLSIFLPYFSSKPFESVCMCICSLAVFVYFRWLVYACTLFHSVSCTLDGVWCSQRLEKCWHTNRKLETYFPVLFLENVGNLLNKLNGKENA